MPLSHRHASLLVTAAALLAVVHPAPRVGAQEPLQFNVPYRCPDGTDNVVTRCQSTPRGEVCYWREEKNGQLIGERYNKRSWMEWLSVCKIQGAQGATEGGPRAEPQGQALDPPYLAGLPPVDRVKRDIHGTDPTDTLARQVAVLAYVPQVIKRMQMVPTRRYNTTTPDEAKLIYAYDLAAYELSQGYLKTHSPEEGKAFSQLAQRYEMDAALRDEVFRLCSPAFVAEYTKIDAAATARYRARIDEQQRDFEQGKARQAAAADAAAPTTAVKPGSQAELSRCIASGRSQRICFSEVMSRGMGQLTGISFTLPSTSGLRMTGAYSGPAGFGLIFQPETAVMVCRGVPSPRPYTVEVTNTQTLVTIQNGPTRVVFALRQDGKLAGSGPIRVTGQVPAGSRTEQTEGMTTQKTTRQRELTPLEAQNDQNARQQGQVYTTTEEATELTYGPTGTRTVTEYVTRTADCTLGVMTPTGPTPLPPDTESPFGLITTIFSGAGTLMGGGSAEAALGEMLSVDTAPAPGLRMSGRYTGQNGFSITFHFESATVACGDAERAHEYSIEKQGTQILVTIRDDAHPIALQLKPDGSLVGDGAVQVDGRVVVGVTEDPKNRFLFAPKVGRCEVGSLVADRPAAAR